MGDLTNAVVQGLQLREQRRMNDFAIDSARQQLAMREQEFAQQQDLKKMTMTQAVLQDFVSRRERLSNQLPDITSKAMEATNALNAARMSADVLARQAGGIPPGMQANIEALARNHEFLTSAAARTQEDAFRIDEAISRLTMESGALGAVYGGSQAARDQPAFPKSKGAQAPAGTGGEQAQAQPAGMEAPAMGGAGQPAGEGGYQTFDPATTAPDDWQKIIGLEGGTVKNGIVRYEADTKDEAEFMRSKIERMSKSLGFDIPAVVVDNSDAIDDARADFKTYGDAIDRARTFVQRIGLALRKDDMSDAELKSIMDTMGDGSEEARQMSQILSLKIEDRKDALFEIKSGMAARQKELQELYDLSKAVVQKERRRIAGVALDAPAQKQLSRTGFRPQLYRPAGGADGKTEPLPASSPGAKQDAPAGMTAAQYLSWYRQQNPGFDPDDEAQAKALSEAYNAYRSKR